MNGKVLEGDGLIEDNQRVENVWLLDVGGEEEGEGRESFSFLEG